MFAAIASAMSIRRRSARIKAVAPSWSVNPSMLSVPTEGASSAGSVGTYDGTQPITAGVKWQTSADNVSYSDIAGQESTTHPAWQAGDVGVYKRFSVTLSGPGGSVTYNTAGAAVVATNPPGSGTASPVWAIPTLDGDGATLADLAGFRVYYSTTDAAEPPSGASYVDVMNPAAVTTTITGLESGRYYVWVASLDATGPGPAVLNSYHDIA